MRAVVIEASSFLSAMDRSPASLRNLELSLTGDASCEFLCLTEQEKGSRGADVHGVVIVLARGRDGIFRHVEAHEEAVSGAGGGAPVETAAWRDVVAGKPWRAVKHPLGLVRAADLARALARAPAETKYIRLEAGDALLWVGASIGKGRGVALDVMTKQGNDVFESL